MIIDIIILVLLFSAILRGKEIGFIQQLFSTIGFFVGLVLGAIIAPHTSQYVHTQLSKSLLSLVVTLGGAILVLFLGETVGQKLKKKLTNLKINRFDNILGSLVSALSVIIGVWLSAAILITLPYVSLQNDLKSSKIISFLNTTLPPTPKIISDIGNLIDPNGFPRVFNSGEPAPTHLAANLPDVAQFNNIIKLDSASVEKISGLGCGGIVEGSGFIVDHNEIATNAHVVAGIKQPYVQINNQQLPAKVIYFNPNLDFALLKVNTFSNKVLQVSSSIAQNNSPAVVLGYPGGGPFSVKTAIILNNFDAIGSNIYGQGNTSRQIYELQANIIPGNSGGPLITANNQVVGIVFAQSTEYNHVGYALTTPKIVKIINSTNLNSPAKYTGNCAE